KLTEDNRMEFGDSNKFIGMSSASYTFEPLYEEYFLKYEDKILGDKESGKNYFIAQIGYKAIPDDLKDKEVIEAAKDGGENHPMFKREYGAQFTDDSDAYFDMKAMRAITLPTGELPTVELKGNSNSEYILAIDPSYSTSKASDDFGMKIIKIDKETKVGYDVHNYAIAGGELKNHIRYLYYLLKNFNIVYVIVDVTGGGLNFIESCNNSALFQSSNMELKHFDLDLDPVNYIDTLKKSKQSYNLTAKKIVHLQQFNLVNIRQMNEHLQYCINFKKIWFASNAAANGNAFERLIHTNLEPLMDGDRRSIYFETVGEFIRDQDAMIDETKKQCSLIQPKTNSATGTQRFDLPVELNKLTGENRPRKDSYTCLLMGAWALKVYLDMQDLKMEQFTFEPFAV
ncbi:MAG: hypothetical protein AABY22_17940, partial [Nanoarchaeota archaeon]